jgi:hypothetical protein
MTNTHLAYGNPKERMLKNIAALWGTKNIDTLDPLVKILVEALSGELHKTHNVIHTFEKRMLERLALLMTPGVLAAPYCAHAIAQAFPNEPLEYISSSDHFFYSKKMNKDQQMKNIHFSPIADVCVLDMNIKHMVIGNTCWTMDDFQQKTSYMNMLHLTSQSNAIWLGVKVNPEIENLNGCSFYFDQLNSTSNHFINQILSTSEWTVAGREIKMSPGRAYVDQKESHSVFSKMDTMHLIEKEVKYLYDTNFISISDSALKLNTLFLEYYPEVFKQLFLEQQLSLFNEKIVWIKITSDSLIHNKNLADINIFINAFPVLNRKAVNQVHRFKNYTNSIPLRTAENEFFLSVLSVEDDFARKYKEIPFTENNIWTNYTYTVRKGGMERMDPRDAKEYLDYIVELMRDESATFASYGQDAIANILKELDQLVSQLNQRVNKKSFVDIDACSYLFLGDPKNDETYFIDYWITNAIHANGIMAGTKLINYKGSQLKKESLCLKTTSVGGKYALDPARHIDAYKYASLTHNKIVTAEDIKACCLHELGDKIDRDITISKGLVLSDNPKQGLIRCVEVLLKKKNSEKNDQEAIDWNTELKNLQSKLELRSALNLTIKVHLS